MDKKVFHVLVTAGDTYEAVDEVRRVTHMATGRLGSLIADEFIRQGAEVTFLCGERSMRPAEQVRQVVEITGVMELLAAMENLLEETAFDCIVHSMAVSDYTVSGVTTEKDLVLEIVQAISKLDKDCGMEEQSAAVEEAIKRARHMASGKISSDLETLTVFLEIAPKVISVVKKKRPDTMLVGFKLLSGVQEDELLIAAKKQMKTSGSDFVLANDLDSIEGDGHCGMLIDHNGVIDRPTTKQEIAQSIAKHVMERLRG